MFVAAKLTTVGIRFVPMGKSTVFLFIDSRLVWRKKMSLSMRTYANDDGDVNIRSRAVALIERSVS